MKIKHLATLAFVVVLALASVANAGLRPATPIIASSGNGDVVSGVKAVNTYFDKRPTQKHAILSTGMCAAGIAFSRNPVGAATVGVPVLVVGNGFAYFLRNSKPVPYSKNDDLRHIVLNIGKYAHNHPTLLQDASGEFCLAYGLTRPGRKIAKPKTPTQGNGGNPGGGNPPSGGGDGGNGSGGSGSGGNGGSGSGGSGNGGGSGSGGNGGGSGSGTGGGNGGGGNGGGSGCQQDCGLPGNGGTNGGHDGKKPPFPGKPHRPGAGV